MGGSDSNNWKYYLDGHYLAHAQCSLWDNQSMPVLFLKVKEQLYEPYEIEAVVVLEASENNPSFQGNLDQTMLGQTICIGLGGSDTAFRIFSGVLGKFQYEGLTSQDSLDNTIILQYIYRIWVYPPLWNLKFDSKIRIFSEMEKRDIISKVLSDNSIEVISQMVDTGITQEMSAQYHETTLDYIIRLMQECGVVAFFDTGPFIAAKDSTVIYNNSIPAYKIVENINPGENFSLSFKTIKIGRHDFGEIIDFSLETASIVNNFSIYEYNFKTPQTPVLGQAQTDSATANVCEIYPNKSSTDNANASNSANDMLNRNVSHQVRFHAVTTAYSATVGSFMNLSDCTASEINGSYFVEEVEHIVEKVDRRWIYRNTISGIPSVDTYLPKITKQKPKITGQQTAIVMGTSDNSQVNIDQYGRIQVRFMWIHGDSADNIQNNITQQPSAWLRVMQWGNAGASWGNYNIPRVGQEVVIGFLNGDPDNPVVLGSVFNTNTTFPYSMTDAAANFVIKTQTTDPAQFPAIPGGAVDDLTDGRYNELRMEDTPLLELVYLRAQSFAKFHVGQDYEKKIKGSSLEVIKGDFQVLGMTNPSGYKIETLGASPLSVNDVTAGAVVAASLLSGFVDVLTIPVGVKVHHVGTGAYIVLVDMGDMTFTVPKGIFNGIFSSLVFVTKGDYSIDVGGDSSHKVLGASSHTVFGDRSDSVSGIYSFKVTGDYSTTVEGEMSISCIGAASITSDALSVTGLGDISMEAIGSISLKAASLTIDAAEISITGGMVSATSGAVFEITAGAMVQIKGAMVQIN